MPGYDDRGTLVTMIDRDGSRKRISSLSVDGFGVEGFLTNRFEVEILRQPPDGGDGYLGLNYLATYNYLSDPLVPELILHR